MKSQEREFQSKYGKNNHVSHVLCVWGHATYCSKGECFRVRKDGAKQKDPETDAKPFQHASIGGGMDPLEHNVQNLDFR